MSLNEVGQIEFLMTCAALVGVFVGFAVSSGVHRFYWSESVRASERSEVVMAGFTIVTINSVILSFTILVGLGLYRWNHGSAFRFETEIGLTVAWLVAFQFQTLVVDILRLQLRAKHYGYIVVFNRVINLSIVAVLGVSGRLSVDSALFASLASACLATLVGLFLIRGEMSATFGVIHLKKLTRFCWPLVWAGVGYWAYAFIDRIMLGMFAGADEVAKYSLGARVAMVVTFLGAGFSAAWGPMAMRINHEDHGAFIRMSTQTWPKLSWALNVGALVISLSMLSVLDLLFGQTSPQVAVVAVLLVFTATFPVLDQLSASSVSLLGRTKVIARTAWIGGLLNIILNLVAVPVMGSLGAAAATFVSASAVTLIFVQYARTHADLPMRPTAITRHFGLVYFFTVVALCAQFLGSSTFGHGFRLGVVVVVLVSVTVRALMHVPQIRSASEKVGVRDDAS